MRRLHPLVSAIRNRFECVALSRPCCSRVPPWVGYLPPNSPLSPREAPTRLRAIVESPLAVEIYERELERRNLRDASRWN